MDASFCWGQILRRFVNLLNSFCVQRKATCLMYVVLFSLFCQSNRIWRQSDFIYLVFVDTWIGYTNGKMASWCNPSWCYDVWCYDVWVEANNYRTAHARLFYFMQMEIFHAYVKVVFEAEVALHRTEETGNDDVRSWGFAELSASILPLALLCCDCRPMILHFNQTNHSLILENCVLKRTKDHFRSI